MSGHIKAVRIAKKGKIHKVLPNGNVTLCARNCESPKGDVGTLSLGSELCVDCFFAGESFELLIQANGSMLRVHSRTECEDDASCAIHKPSNHPLSEAPYIWRSDSDPQFMERVCEHGIGHPDRDGLAWLKQNARYVEWYDAPTLDALGIHGCDGCCRRQEDPDD